MEARTVYEAGVLDTLRRSISPPSAKAENATNNIVKTVPIKSETVILTVYVCCEEIGVYLALRSRKGDHCSIKLEYRERIRN